MRQNLAMTDTRFTAECDDLQELLNTIDVDEVDDIETLFMFLFRRSPSTLGRPSTR